MSISDTKSQLLSYLANDDNRVIALTGKWGTGKSHLWNEIRSASTDEAVRKSLYVSLFGIKSIGQVKLLLMQDAIRARTSKEIGTVVNAVPKIVKGLQALRKEFSILHDVGEAAAPLLLKDKLVVIDDIERKHKDLDIDEVLGFIDNYSQTHSTRFILVLNNDKLSDRDPWDQLREKVIDQELQLRTSPAEAFDIANAPLKIPYSEQVKKAVEACGISNIRIIQKILKAVALIFSEQADLRDDVLSQIVPSTVLFGAIHFKGIEKGPSFDFVLSYGSRSAFGSLFSDAPAPDEDSDVPRWEQLLTKLGIASCDRYEHVLKDFLESGLLDASAVSDIIKEYNENLDRSAASAQLRAFQRRFVWDTRIPYDELLRQALDLTKKVQFFDAQEVSMLADHLLQLEGGEVAADQLMQQWLAAFRQKHPNGISVSDEPLWNGFRPEIREGLLAMRSDGDGSTTVLEACLKISAESGWGSRENTAFSISTVETFEDLLHNCPIDKFPDFLRQMMQFVVHAPQYKPSFGSGIDNFVEACRRVCGDPEQARLKRLIEDLFRGVQQSALLESPVAEKE